MDRELLVMLYKVWPLCSVEWYEKKNITAFWDVSPVNVKQSHCTPMEAQGRKKV
jgi:hypothetical protein